jgi:hypothetical protein
MKFFVLTIFICSASLLFSQVKKRELGYYQGTISSYTINTGQELLTVDSSEIIIWLENDRISFKIDNKKYKGTYTVKKRNKRDYTLKVKLGFSDIEEELRITGKNKSIWRKGLFPQPDSVLHKLKKKAVVW